MGKKFLYRIFDNKTGVWLPEKYTNVEVCELFGLSKNMSVSQYTKHDCLIRGRYAIKVVGNVEVPDAWAVEWDSARLKLLGTGRGGEDYDKSTVQLLPCPFCGGEADITCDTPIIDSNGFKVICNKCGTTSGMVFSQEKAIEVWNTRKPMERIEEMLDEAMERQWGYYDKAKGEGSIRQMDYSDGCAEGLRTAIEIVKEELN